MTVAELIDKLAWLDPNTLVAVDSDQYDDWVETNITLQSGVFGREDANYGWFFTPEELNESQPHHLPCVLLKSAFR